MISYSNLTLILMAYMLGSVPSAVWVGKMLYGIDVRDYGSGNAGATNTFRVLGKKAGLPVLIMDILKGFLAVKMVWLTGKYLPDTQQFINLELSLGIASLLGHIFPIFAGFRGGKGVATSLGVVIGIVPLAAAVSMIIFLLVFISSRFVSLGAITAALFFPFVLKFAVGTDSVWLLSFGVVVSSMVIVAHRKNIKRLLKGEENKMNFSKK